MSVATWKAWAIATTTRRLKTSQLENRLLGGAYWSLVGAAASRGASLLASFFLAHLLGREMFGEFGAVDSTIGMFAVFGNLGLAVSTTKLLSQHRSTDRQTAGQILALSNIYAVTAGLIAAMTLAIAAPWMAKNSLASESLTLDLRLGALVLFFSAVNGTLSGALTAFHAFRALARVSIVTGVLTIPMLVGGAFSGGVEGAVAGLVIIQAITCALQVKALRASAKAQGIEIVWQGCWGERWRLVSYSVPAFVSSALNTPVNWLCIALLINFGGGYSQMGLLQVVNTWFLVLLFVPGKLAPVYYPLLEDLLAHGDREGAHKLVWKLVGISTIGFGIAVLCFHFFATVILNCYGPQYSGAKAALIVTAWTAAISAASQPLGIFVVALSRMWDAVLCSAFAAVCNVLAMIALVNQGALGFAEARLVGNFASAVLTTYFVLRAMRGSENDRSAAGTRPFAAGNPLPLVTQSSATQPNVAA